MRDQETEKLQEAAKQTISTLNRMLRDKNEQLQEKENVIMEMRNQMMNQKEEDALKIAEMHKEMSLVGGTTLNKLHELVTKQSAHADGPRFNPKYDRLSREELQRALDDKDHLIHELRVQLKGAEEEKATMHRKKNEALTRVA